MILRPMLGQLRAAIQRELAAEGVRRVPEIIEGGKRLVRKGVEKVREVKERHQRRDDA